MISNNSDLWIFRYHSRKYAAESNCLGLLSTGRILPSEYLSLQKMIASPDEENLVVAEALIEQFIYGKQTEQA